ncbi:MAG: DNA repair protein RecN [Schleiferiaceae bacterium]|tara:strand:- start:54731 stop:56380 length:1650 start_codon:yes stop_codon:yes gene_type:complete
MLNGLYIKNFALINSLDQRIEQGFTVLTGETGAGKSILLGALQLALGGRADLKNLTLDGKKCIVEAEFILDPKKWKVFFEKNDWDFSESTTLRREIVPNGKSRAFINDSPVKLEGLRCLSEMLIDVHSQRDSFFLKNPQFIIDFLDSFGDLHAQRDNYETTYNKLNKIKSKLNNLNTLNGENIDLDYLKFVLDELKSANLKLSEENDLTNELEILSSSEEIQLLFDEIRFMSENENGLDNNLSRWMGCFDKLKQKSNIFSSIRNEASSVQDMYQTIMYNLESWTEKIDANPNRLKEVEERLAFIEQLKLKHRASSVEGLLNLESLWQDQIEEIENKSRDVKNFQQELLKLEKEVLHTAELLHQKRSKLFSSIEKNVIDSLGNLNMKGTKFIIRTSKLSSPAIYGNYKYSIDFSANSGQSLMPVEKVASGGERNRLFLVLKSLFAKGVGLETIIFDEIDSGVSGETAAKMAEMFSDIGKHSQVIAITHLPQVAAAGSYHWKVQKNIEEGRTSTQLKNLDFDERQEEIARLLTGEKVSEAAMAQAKFLLEN